MRKKMRAIYGCLFAFSLLAGSVASAEGIAVVNFEKCFTDSKMGKKEDEGLQNLRKQASSRIESKEKELNELAAKLNDPEYMDGLSPEAEAELQDKIRSLNEELMRFQNQYYQLANQAQMRVMQQLYGEVSKAAAIIAQAQEKSVVLNSEICFYSDPSLNITPQVIAEMDKTFEAEPKTEEPKS